jgi:hypothetical protein
MAGALTLWSWCRPWNPWDMRNVYEAAGGNEGLRRLAEAWHARVMADEIVSHAFRHGVHPQHSVRLAAYWAEALGGPTTYSDNYGDETSVGGSTAATAHTRRWTAERSPASTEPWTIWDMRRILSGGCCTNTSPGPPRRPCRATTSPPTTSPNT